jgi:hypothetical protein
MQTIGVMEVAARWQNLSKDHREFLDMVAVRGASYEEAAKRLNVQVGTIRSRLARARKDADPTREGSRGSKQELQVQQNREVGNKEEIIFPSQVWEGTCEPGVPSTLIGAAPISGPRGLPRR